MLWHIYLTRYCNLQCTYCGADPKFETIPLEPQYTINELISFLKQDEEPILNFYGGEPLLRIKKMIEMIDSLSESIPTIKFVLQTNGLLLHKIPVEYVHRFHSILVSIDGRPDITDNYRGKNVFTKLRENLNYITKTCAFQGEVIARMTISRYSDIYKEVTYLLDPENGLGFTHVHWQLDALWNSKSWPDFTTWLTEAYTPSLKKLLSWWVDEIQENNKVHKIIPFLGIMTTLLTNEPTGLRCGAGHTSYTISTDGNLIFCPICPEEPEAITGSIHSSMSEIKKVALTEPCNSCDVLTICGGRCLYTNYFKTGTTEEYSSVCDATKVLIHDLQEKSPILNNLISLEKIFFQDIKYPEINN